MLDPAGDTAGDIEFGTHGHTGPADPAGMFYITGIYCRTRCAYFAAKGFGKVEKKVEILFAAYTVTTGYDDRCILDIYFRLLDPAVDDFNYEIGVIYIFLCIKVDYLAFVRCIVNLFFSSRPRER